jgi:hypothetical protein
VSKLAQDHDEACRRGAALWGLGPLAGTGATIWKRVIADELERYDEARGRFRNRTADLATWERLNGIGMVLVVAVSQVLAFGERVQNMTGDAQLARALADFNATAGDVKSIRDMAVHLDAYATGEGHRQTNRGRQAGPSVRDAVNPFHSWVSTTFAAEDGTPIEGPEAAILDLGDEQINLHRAGEAAMVLADVIEQTRQRYEQKAEERADELERAMYPR